MIKIIVLIALVFAASANIQTNWIKCAKEASSLSIQIQGITAEL